MAVESFIGPEHFVQAVEASLSQDFSAVIVQRAVPHARNIFRRNARPIALLREALPGIDKAEELIRTWAAKQGREYAGMGNGYRVIGGIALHFDGNRVSPFALSLGIGWKASWRTQSVDLDYLDARGERFDPDRPIDTFEQSADDLVIVPGVPHPSLHEVIAKDTRTARVFTTGLMLPQA